MTGRPRLYFSFRSPYSWLAVHRLRKAVPDLFDVVDLFPYWPPDEETGRALALRGGRFHYTEMSRAKHRYLLVDVRRLVEREGLAVRWPIDVEPCWELPHLAWLLARHAGRALPFYDAVTEARWGRGQNICDPEVIRAAARRAGIDPERAAHAPEDGSVREEAVGCLHQAHLDDVFGVPYLRWGWHRFWGFDRMDDFLEVWRPGRDVPEQMIRHDTAVDTGNDINAIESLDIEPLDRAYAYGSDCGGGCG
jgi:2-hydroxychromene-2-carboxylate isomerase